jgi:hypothetical protein
MSRADFDVRAINGNNSARNCLFVAPQRPDERGQIDPYLIAFLKLHRTHPFHNSGGTKDKSSRKLGVCNTGKTVGQFLMDLGSTDRHISRGSEAQLDPISVNLQHDNLNVLANEDSFARLSAEN